MLLGHMGEVGNVMMAQEDAADEEKRIVDMVCDGDIEELLGLQECSNYGLMGGVAGIGYSCLCGSDDVLNLLCAK